MRVRRIDGRGLPVGGARLVHQPFGLQHLREMKMRRGFRGTCGRGGAARLERGRRVAALPQPRRVLERGERGQH